VTGTAANSQGTGATATNGQDATGASNSASPANTSGGGSSPDSTSGGGGSNGDGSDGRGGGDGNGGGSGSGSGSDTQNRGSGSSGLSQGELAAVILLPILALLALLFLLFRFYPPLWERFTAWRHERNERGEYKRALDDPVGVFAIKHRRRSTGLSLPDMQSIMRPLSFGFTQPKPQTIKRKPLNWDANHIGTNGFSSIGMAVPSSTGAADGAANGGHQRNESEVSAVTRTNSGNVAAPPGRPRTDSDASSVSSISSAEESTGFVDARTSQRASQLTSRTA